MKVTRQITFILMHNDSYPGNHDDKIKDKLISEGWEFEDIENRMFRFSRIFSL